MDQEHAAVGIHVGPRVLGLAMLCENLGRDLIHELHEVDELVVLDVLLGKLGLAREAGVGFSEHGVSVSRDDASALEHLPALLPHLVGRHLRGSHVLLEVLDEAQHLLVREAVEGSGEAVHRSREREIRVRKGAADQVARVSGHVATLVVRVDREVEPHELHKLGVREAKHVDKVLGHVAVILAGQNVAVLEDIAVNESCDAGKAGDASEHVLIGVHPVLRLLHALLVRRGKV
mmetsp:Transcript_22133/g.55817  ORF Transcript_22133/g.55817 Transcript_22133/m.55817 type:complete len:233 (-) Transcript_22133:113-811(-)